MAFSIIWGIERLQHQYVAAKQHHGDDEDGGDEDGGDEPGSERYYIGKNLMLSYNYVIWF